MLFLCHKAYKYLVRPVIRLCFWRDPEAAHLWALSVLEWIERHPKILAWLDRVGKVHDKRLHQPYFGGMEGLVILAAGFTKDGRGIRALSSLFDCVIIGTVLPGSQRGHHRPRIWWHWVGFLRWLLRNRMGFPGQGVIEVVRRLRQYEVRFDKLPTKIGISIGAMADANPEIAIGQYLFVYDVIREQVDCLVDFFEINISSPSTEWLRLLGTQDFFEYFLAGLLNQINSLDRERGWVQKEIAIKLSPDMTDEEVENLARVCRKLGIHIFSCTNTTTKRSGLPERLSRAPGGLSGWYLLPFALHTTRQIHELIPGSTIIGTGGIKDYRTACEFREAGASLFGVYTAFFDEFPLIGRVISKRFIKEMDRVGATNLGELRRK